MSPDLSAHRSPKKLFFHHYFSHLPPSTYKQDPRLLFPKSLSGLPLPCSNMLVSRLIPSPQETPVWTGQGRQALSSTIICISNKHIQALSCCCDPRTEKHWDLLLFFIQVGFHVLRQIIYHSDARISVRKLDGVREKPGEQTSTPSVEGGEATPSLPHCMASTQLQAAAYRVTVPKPFNFFYTSLQFCAPQPTRTKMKGGVYKQKAGS